VIHKVERQDNTIHIKAGDDMLVAGVQARVLDETGKAIESRDGE
jgi:hypothetical protein